jgi:hypothetical protein
MNRKRPQQAMSLVDVNELLATTHEIAEERGIPTGILAVEMIVAAAEAIIAVSGGINRQALAKEIQTVLSNIPDTELRDGPERSSAEFLARAVFARAQEMELDLMAIAKEVLVVSYAELVDGDKELSRQIASIMFPAFCAKVRRLCELGSSQGMAVIRPPTDA